jgi:hypothetical protein
MVDDITARSPRRSPSPELGTGPRGPTAVRPEVSEGPSTGFGRSRWVREWWLWPLALLTLGWALMLGAYAWNHEDEQRQRQRQRHHASPRAALDLDESPAGDHTAAAQPFSMHGRVLVEHGLVVRPAARAGSTIGSTVRTTVGVTQWLFPVVDADWRDGQAVKHVLRVPEGAPLRALSHAPQGPWLVTDQGAATSALAQALRAKGLKVDASTALVQWHSSPIEP